MPSRRRAREFALQVLYAHDLEGTPTPTGGQSSRALSKFWATRMEAEALDPVSLEAIRIQLEQAEAGGTAPASEEEVDFASTLVRGVWDQQATIDERIEKASLHWRLPRMPIVDRNILRIGVFELIQRRDIPVSVSINEAIELSKRYGSAESRAFVNGILDRIAADIGRGGRASRPAPKNPRT